MTEHEQLSFSFPVNSGDILEAVFDDAFRALVKKQPRPKIVARFYPYAGLSSTIRLRQGRIYARVSDILVDSPREVLFALACTLVAKLYRLKISKEHERTYREHVLHPTIVDASQSARRRRGYKITTSSRGKAYDLAELFTALNARYFGGKLERPLLSWSPRPTRKVLGHHDHVHRAIIISRTLDDMNIPRFVVEYVLYHEMLHVKHPTRVISGRTIYHGRAFREDERQFERMDAAVEWLDEIAKPSTGNLRRRRSKPRR
jgi:hypothetical protein